MRKESKFLSLIAIVLLVASCKTIPIASKPRREMDFNQYLAERVEDSRSDYVSCDQVDIRLSSGEARNLRAKVYVKKGEYIYASVSFLGIEVGRAELSADSIKIINRIERTYYFGSNDAVLDKMGGNLSYYQIESLLLKGLIRFPGESRKKLRNHIADSGEYYVYTYQPGSGSYVKSYFDKETFKESKIEISDRASDFYLTSDLTVYNKEREYPEEMSVKVKMKDFITDINISIGRISDSRFERRNFAVNSKYSELVF